MPEAPKPAVLIASGPWDAKPWGETLRALDPDRPVYCWPDTFDPASVRYLLAWKPAPEALVGLNRIDVIFSLGAGVDHLRGLTLPDAPLVRIIDDDMTGRMVEWVVMQVLMHHRQQLTYAEQQVSRTWKELRQPAASEVSVGVMGLGVLGEAAAKALAGLGFRVTGWSRSAKSISGVETFSGADGLDPFLAQTDILVCLLPHTDETEGILNRPLFERLSRRHPAGPALINAGRGAVQDEQAIAGALADGTLAGASLDVFGTEPLPAESPLWDAPNLIITPHVSAPSEPSALVRRIHRQIIDFEAGRPLDGLVDRARGY